MKPRTGLALVARSLTLVAGLCAAGVGAQGLAEVVPLRAGHQGMGLHQGLLVMCIAIFLLVSLLMFLAVIRHRREAGVSQTHFHASLVVEMVWTLVPFLIVSGMGFASIRGLVT